MNKKAKGKGKLGLVKINLWIPSDLHEAVKFLVEQEKKAGRETSISKVYANSLRAYVGAWIQK